MPPLTVLVPVNRLDRAKGRLAGLLTPPERAELTRRTLATVLAAVNDAGARAVVLTADPAVAEAAAGRAEVLDEDPAASGLNGQLESALTRLDGDEVLILHADLPLATGEALRALHAAARPAPSATLVRSPDGGTNAMLLRPPGRFPLAYGRGSCDLHVAAAREAGMAAREVEAPALLLDLDTPGDLVTLLATSEGRASQAGAYLTAIGAASRG